MNSSTGSTRPVRVTHLITDLDVGGAELMLARLVERLDARRIESQVICLSSLGPVGEQMSRAGIPVTALNMRRGRVAPASLWRLARHLKAARPDLIQTWLYHSDLLGTVAAMLLRVPGLVWNIRCADLNAADHPRSLVWVVRALALLSSRPRAVVCNSRAGQQVHERLGYRPRLWKIITNGFDVDRFCPEAAARDRLRVELGLPADTPVVGLLGRYHLMKDHATFVRAAAMVAARHATVHFAVAGRGVTTSEALGALVTDLGVQARVHLMPETGKPAEFLASLDVAVCSSYSEAFPNVVGEAMACGVPCVVTDVGESARLVGETGIVVAPRSPVAMGQAILDLVELDPAARRGLGVMARARIAREFSLARVAQEYEAFYLGLAAASDTVSPLVCAE